MLNKFKKISFILLISLPIYASSGNEGGGGDIIACYDKPLYLENGDIDRSAIIVGKPSLKDYWEMAETMGALELSLKKGRDYKEKILFALNRLAKVDKVRSYRLIQRFQSSLFYHLTSRSRIPDIDDAPMIVEPRAEDYCYDVQIAIQLKKTTPLQSKVLIDQNLFQLLSEEHKAGLILHELLYEEEIKFKNARTSNKARWFNAIISSNYIDSLADIRGEYSNEYFKLIVSMKLNYRTRNKNYRPKNSNFFEEEVIVYSPAKMRSKFRYWFKENYSLTLKNMPFIDELNGTNVKVRGGDKSSGISFLGEDRALFLSLKTEIDNLEFSLRNMKFKLSGISYLGLTQNKDYSFISFKFKKGDVFHSEVTEKISKNSNSLSMMINNITGEVEKLSFNLNSLRKLTHKGIAFESISDVSFVDVKGSLALKNVSAQRISYQSKKIWKKCKGDYCPSKLDPFSFIFSNDLSLGRVKKDSFGAHSKSNFRFRFKEDLNF